ncbi:MAG: sulfatase [Planctomycetota bacterium]
MRKGTAVPGTLPARRAAGAALAILLAAACGGEEEVRADAGATAKPPNVLLISLDSVRRDALGVHGGGSPFAPGVSPSPRLDALAAEGVLLEDAHATTSWTLPSHVAIFAGAPEIVHAVDADEQRPGEETVPLAARLREHGYRTAGFYSGPYLDPRFGFDRGFDRYEACYGPDLAAAAARAAAVRVRLAAARDAGDAVRVPALESALAKANRDLEALSHRDVSAAAVTAAALAELDAAAAGDAPFFLFLHYFDPHYDYRPPAPHDRAFDPDYAGEVDGTDLLGDPRISVADANAPAGRVRTASDRDLAHVRALYAGGIAGTEAEIGRVLDRLAERGLAARTLVVVTADHGDEFFEHGSLGHRRTLFAEVTRVPLLLRLPGVLPAGRRVAGLVSLADLAPTILDLAGLPVPEANGGTSFGPFLRGEAGDPGRGVLGRIVTQQPLLVHLPRETGDRVTVSGRRVSVLESWRRGSLLILRERTWVRADPGTDPALAREVEIHHGAGRRADLLRWIDVERFPGEEEEGFSTDFADPRARAELRRFHDRYGELLAARARARRVETTGDVQALLRGLGYAGGLPGGPLGEADLLLPPPGDAVLGEEDRR